MSKAHHTRDQAARQQAERKRLAQTLPTPCHRCHRTIHPDDPWDVDHDPPLSIDPEAPAYASCARCNRSHGAGYGNRLRGTRRAIAKQEATLPPLARAVSSNGHLDHPEGGVVYPQDQLEVVDIATPFADSPRSPGEWDGLPRTFPGPHPEAVDSLGDAAAASMEARSGQRLRWWAWLVTQRMLERRADGSWCWPIVFVSVSRQSGKTWLLCELALWRAGNAALFGGRQEVLQTGQTVSVGRLMQQRYWDWASHQGFQVAKVLGDSQIVFGDGSLWRTVAASNVWGRSVDLMLSDEVWAWSADVFWSGLWPTLVERPRSQAVLFSAANPETRDLVPGLRSNPSVCRLEWGAVWGADFTDPAVHRAASPSWSRQRAEAMRIASSEAGFAENWLNIWPGEGVGRSRPERLVDGRAWGAAVVSDRPVAVVAGVEDRTGSGAAAAAAGVLPGGRVVVWGRLFSDRAAAVEWARGTRARRLLVGASLAADVDGAERVGAVETSAALPRLRDLMARGLVRHDGGMDLTGQLLALLVVEREGGLSVVSQGRSDLVRAAAWCVRAAAAPAPRRPVWAVA